MGFLLSDKNRFGLIAIFTLVVIFLLSINQISDFDTGYHLKTGEYVLENLSVPKYDVFSYSANGARWIAHYWLSGVIFFLVNQVAGFPGLLVFVALLSALTYYIVLKTTLLWTTPSPAIPATILALFFLVAELWVVRPQIFSYFFTALIIFILEYWRKTNSSRVLLWLPPIFLLWANMHAGVILGIVILGVYALGAVVNKVKSGVPIRYPATLFLISSLITLINPNGYETLTYNFTISDAIRDMNIQEWQSMFQHLYTWQSKVFLLMMITSLILVLWHNLKRRGKPEIDWTSLVLISGGFIMPFISVRHVGLFPIIAAPLVIQALQNVIHKNSTKNEMEKLLSGFCYLFIAMIIIITPIKIWNRPIVNDSLLPVGAVNFIEANNIKGPMFNWVPMGGYLIWRLWPDQLVFQDGRSEVFAGEPNANLLKVLYNQPGWKELINDKYEINYFIMAYQSPITEVISSWFFKTTSLLDFKLVYWDDAAIILLKNTPENKVVVDKYAYEIINPFIYPQNIEQGKLPQAAEEIKRALSIAPKSRVLQNYILNFAPQVNN
ncbi:MAG: hypothetical protein NUV96_01850 [Candidatus Colwellbacteria bacterium]|nr:hypothetical protein [Candidatus Colwellbacteria bacterium]